MTLSKTNRDYTCRYYADAVCNFLFITELYNYLMLALESIGDMTMSECVYVSLTVCVLGLAGNVELCDLATILLLPPVLEHLAEVGTTCPSCSR